MFVKNPTDMPVTLKRGLILEDIAVLCVGLVLTFRVGDDDMLEWLANDEGSPHDPPSAARRLLWRGTSVTASGHVAGPVRPPFASAVHLRVGDDVRSLVVAGPRRWQRVAGQLQPSEPEPFDAIPLSWSRAFGGGYELEPGLDPLSQLPHPGGRVAHPLNPDGCGFYADAQDAVGQLLPNIEDPRALIRRVDDAPAPVCFAPCPELMSLRGNAIAGPLTHQPAKDDREKLRQSIDASLWLQHHAPPDLIFEEISERTRVELQGVGGSPMRFAMPRCPVAVAIRDAHGATRDTRARIRSVHVDGDTQRVQVCWGFGHRYDIERPPHWIEVQSIGGTT